MSKKKQNYEEKDNNKRNVGPKSYSKGRKNSKKPNSKNSTVDDIRNSANNCYGGNDISWYTTYPELTLAASQIPFAYQPGRELPMEKPTVTQSIIPENDQDVYYGQGQVTHDRYPGIMSFGLYPSVGYSKTISDPLNVAAREVYARIRSKYSGSLEADAPDIMMYSLAIDGLYMLYEDMKRAYYVATLNTPYNLYYPRTLLGALGYDYDDILNNLKLFEQRIFEAGRLLTKFMVPDNMDLYKRHQFMCSNIYADSPERKSQLYTFRLDGIYALTRTETMTELSIYPIHASGRVDTVDEVWNKFKFCMDIIMSWDTGYTITGYLERAYEGESYLSPKVFIPGGLLEPVYNPEMLLQIHNLTVANVQVGSLKVTQDPTANNVMISEPFAASLKQIGGVTSTCVNQKSILSIATDAQPTSDLIIVASRLQCAPREPRRIRNSIIVLDCATEVIHDVSLYLYEDSALQTYDLGSTSLIYYGAKDTYDQFFNNQFIPAMAVASTFSEHPLFYMYTMDESKGPGGDARLDIFGELHNVAIVDDKTLRNLHRMCIYSEFNCFR